MRLSHLSIDTAPTSRSSKSKSFGGHGTIRNENKARQQTPHDYRLAFTRVASTDRVVQPPSHLSAVSFKRTIGAVTIDPRVRLLDQPQWCVPETITGSRHERVHVFGRRLQGQPRRFVLVRSVATAVVVTFAFTVRRLILAYRDCASSRGGRQGVLSKFTIPVVDIDQTGVAEEYVCVSISAGVAVNSCLIRSIHSLRQFLEVDVQIVMVIVVVFGDRNTAKVPLESSDTLPAPQDQLRNEVLRDREELSLVPHHGT